MPVYLLKIITMTHWKMRFTNPKYLGVAHLYEADDRFRKLSVTIDRFVEKEPVFGTNGKQELCSVAYFKEVEQGLILKPTNLRRIEQALGTPDTGKWLRKKIVLQVEQATLPTTPRRADGSKGTEPVLRVSTDPSDYAKPALSDDRLPKLIDAIKSKTTTLESVQGKFALTEDQISKIKGETE